VLHLWRTVRLVWRIAPGWTLANAVLAVVQGVLPLGAIYLMKLIIGSVTQGIGSADKGAAFRHTAILILLAALVGLLSAVARSVSTLVSEAQAQGVTDHMSDIMHAKSVAVDLEYYENSRYYDTLHRAQQEAPFRPTSIINGLVQFASSGVSLIAMAALLFSLHWIVAVIVFAAAVPGALVRLRYSNRLYRWQRDHTVEDRQSYYYHWLLTVGERAKEIRLFGLGDLLMDWYRGLRRLLRRQRLEITARRAAADFATQTAATVAVFGTFAYIARQTIRGVFGVDSMVMYYMAFQTSLSSLQTVLQALAGLYEDNLFLTYYYDFMALETKVKEAPEPRPVPRPLSAGIVFEGVTFQYPDTERTAISDISLTIRPGEVAALVGPNGSGKTTIVKLLCRLYDPHAGRITLDGVDLRDFGLVDLRRHMSVIFQDFAQYQLTARQNIWIGNIDLSPEDGAIEEAARASGADGLIRNLRHGYDTLLGKWFADGEELSTGEWQKIALARAFVRDSEILVLDEPTSALDPVAEWQIFERIRELARGRAVILISHRFSTVRTADRIHILDEGRILESGSHDELIARGGRYAEMYAVQARGFQ
jgi:ATP-binding cassette subfamily B protein